MTAGAAADWLEETVQGWHFLSEELKTATTAAVLGGTARAHGDGLSHSEGKASSLSRERQKSLRLAANLINQAMQKAEKGETLAALTSMLLADPSYTRRCATEEVRAFEYQPAELQCAAAALCTPAELVAYTKYSDLKVADLKQALGDNAQLKGGNKPELILRCADAAAFGSLPKCPVCDVGRLKFENGAYYCPGGYDEDLARYRPCSGKWSESPVCMCVRVTRALLREEDERPLRAR